MANDGYQQWQNQPMYQGHPDSEPLNGQSREQYRGIPDGQQHGQYRHPMVVIPRQPSNEFRQYHEGYDARSIRQPPPRAAPQFHPTMYAPSPVLVPSQMQSHVQTSQYNYSGGQRSQPAYYANYPQPLMSDRRPNYPPPLAHGYQERNQTHYSRQAQHGQMEQPLPSSQQRRPLQQGHTQAPQERPSAEHPKNPVAVKQKYASGQQGTVASTQPVPSSHRQSVPVVTQPRPTPQQLVPVVPQKRPAPQSHDPVPAPPQRQPPNQPQASRTPAAPKSQPPSQPQGSGTSATPKVQPPIVSTSQQIHRKSDARSQHLTSHPRFDEQTRSDDELGGPADDHALLLALADEYISQAHSMSSSFARTPTTVDCDEYYSLLATGLRCIESVLETQQFPNPRSEARLRLRYASLLYEETDNEQEAQDVLSKGIALCERSRLVDLKYSMQHLMARLQFKSNPRAALKMVDKLLPDIEAYQHTAWIFAFRFLRVSLSLQVPTHPDVSGAFVHLRALTSLAERQRTVPVVVVSSAIETFLHLRSSTADSVDLAQRALATARTHQLDPSLRDLPQLTALVDCLDLACDIVCVKPEQAATKLGPMQKITDTVMNNRQWRDSEVFYVPLGTSASDGMAEDTAGIFHVGDDKKCALSFHWLRASELYGMCYLLSGMGSMCTNSVDGRAEKYLSEGLKLTHEDFVAGNVINQSIDATCAFLEQRSLVNETIKLNLVFAACNRSDWQSAQRTLDDLIKATKPRGVQAAQIYLNGVIKQAIGAHHEALSCFRAPELVLPVAPTKLFGADLDFRILATLNSILILRQDETTAAEAQSLLDRVEPYCTSHIDKSMSAAHNILRATTSTELAIITHKNLLNTALNTSRRLSNNQLQAISLNIMTLTIFGGIVGEQAIKCARAGRVMAQKIKSPLWTVVADGMLSDTMRISGNNEGAVKALNEAQGALAKLPKAVRERFSVA